MHSSITKYHNTAVRVAIVVAVVDDDSDDDDDGVAALAAVAAVDAILFCSFNLFPSLSSVNVLRVYMLKVAISESEFCDNLFGASATCPQEHIVSFKHLSLPHFSCLQQKKPPFKHSLSPLNCIQQHSLTASTHIAFIVCYNPLLFFDYLRQNPFSSKDLF